MSSPRPIDREQVEQAAARWVMRREEPGWGDADQRALESWLDQSMAHKAAFWRLEHGWRQADRLRSLGDAVAIEHRPRFGKWMAGAQRPMAIAASFLLVLIAALAYLGMHRSADLSEVAQQTIATPMGGYKRIPLSDGSRIELNTATVLRTAVTAQLREVWLDRGEAYFEVRHSDRVPFVVHAGPRKITVVGTKFSVRRDGQRVSVWVVEGRVRVDSAERDGAGNPLSGSSSTMIAGEAAIADGASTMIAAKSEERVESALAWRDGMLSFDRMPLRAVANEFNRYNARKLVIDDPKVAVIRIGGTFQASNVDAFARLLRDAYGLRVEAGEHELKISE